MARETRARLVVGSSKDDKNPAWKVLGDTGVSQKTGSFLGVLVVRIIIYQGLLWGSRSMEALTCLLDCFVSWGGRGFKATQALRLLVTLLHMLSGFQNRARISLSGGKAPQPYWESTGKELSNMFTCNTNHQHSYAFRNRPTASASSSRRLRQQSERHLGILGATDGCGGGGGGRSLSLQSKPWALLGP